MGWLQGCTASGTAILARSNGTSRVVVRNFGRVLRRAHPIPGQDIQAEVRGVGRTTVRTLLIGTAFGG